MQIEDFGKKAQEIAVKQDFAAEFLRIKEKLSEENQKDLYRLVIGLRDRTEKETLKDVSNSRSWDRNC